MNSILIGYDLNKIGQDYSALIEKIKTFSYWWYCLDSTWIIKSNLSCDQIRDLSIPCLDSNDELLVVKLTGEVA